MSTYRGPILILLASFCFSTTGLSQALAPSGASPLVIGAVRLWLGCFFLLIWCIFTKKLPSLRGWPLGRTITSALCILIYQLTFFAAVATTGVAVGTLATCGSIPLAAGILAFIFIGEKPKKIWYGATVLAIVGLGLLSFTGNIEAKPLGLLLAAIAGTAYAAYVTFAKTLSLSHPPETIIAVLFAIGAVLALPIFFIFPVGWMLSGRGMLICAHLGLITAATGYTIYLAGLKSTPVSSAATLNLSESLLAACWGIFLLQEPVTVQSGLGMLLLFSATVMLAVKSK